MLIGLYSGNAPLQPESLTADVQAILAELCRQGFRTVLFDSSGIDAEHGRVQGWLIEEGGTLSEFRSLFPDAVIPIGRLAMEMHSEEERRLRECVPFTTHPLRVGKGLVRKLNRGQKRREREWLELQPMNREGITEAKHRVHLHRNRYGAWAVVGIYSDGMSMNRVDGMEEWLRLSEVAAEMAEEINESHPYLIDELCLEVKGWKLLTVGEIGPSEEGERAIHKVAYAAYLAEVNLSRQQHTSPALIAMLSPGDLKEALLREACAYVAAGYGHRFCHLHPQDLTVLSPLLKGSWLREGKWEYRYFAKPDVVYDRLKAKGSPEYAQAYARLREVPSTEDRLGGSFSKTKLYHLLSRDPQLSSHLLPFEALTGQDQALHAIQTYGASVIKPDTGSFGDRLLFVEASSDHYVLQDHHHLHRMSREQLAQLLNALESQDQPYLIQRFLDSSTPQGMVFFIRVHLVKDRRGLWKLCSPIVYLSTQRQHKNPNHRTNFWVYSLWETFVRHHYEDFQVELNEALRTVSIQLTRYLDRVLPERFSEVGIDFGLDAERKLWIFEANLNKVGVRFRELEVARLIIPVAIALITPTPVVEQESEGGIDREQ